MEAVAPSPRPVVVTRETGTGKEAVARLLHRRSGRTGPFVAVDCCGFSEGLLASELLGHVRGAFTGAIRDQPGPFRAARGGTLLLDEAGDLPPALQPTLLPVLETWVVRPVGSQVDVAVDVQVAASNRELAAQAAPEAAPVDVSPAGLDALLRRFHGRVAEVARQAGVSRHKLCRLLWAAGLDPGSYRVD